MAAEGTAQAGSRVAGMVHGLSVLVLASLGLALEGNGGGVGWVESCKKWEGLRNNGQGWSHWRVGGWDPTYSWVLDRTIL